MAVHDRPDRRFSVPLDQPPSLFIPVVVFIRHRREPAHPSFLEPLPIGHEERKRDEILPDLRGLENVPLELLPLGLELDGSSLPITPVAGVVRLTPALFDPK